jgi:hypothetical protein
MDKSLREMEVALTRLEVPSEESRELSELIGALKYIRGEMMSLLQDARKGKEETDQWWQQASSLVSDLSKRKDLIKDAMLSSDQKSPSDLQGGRKRPGEIKDRYEHQLREMDSRISLQIQDFARRASDFLQSFERTAAALADRTSNRLNFLVQRREEELSKRDKEAEIVKSESERLLEKELEGIRQQVELTVASAFKRFDAMMKESQEQIRGLNSHTDRIKSELFNSITEISKGVQRELEEKFEALKEDQTAVLEKLNRSYLRILENLEKSYERMHATHQAILTSDRSTQASVDAIRLELHNAHMTNKGLSESVEKLASDNQSSAGRIVALEDHLRSSQEELASKIAEAKMELFQVVQQKSNESDEKEQSLNREILSIKGTVSESENRMNRLGSDLSSLRWESEAREKTWNRTLQGIYLVAAIALLLGAVAFLSILYDSFAPYQWQLSDLRHAIFPTLPFPLPSFR